MATVRTVNELIQACLRVIGVLGSEQTMAPAELADGLTVFQDMISGMQYLVPGTTTEAITLVSAQASYTVGESGAPDLNTMRPEHIFNAFIRDSSNYDHDVEVISENRYNSIKSKTASGRPDVIWYNPTAPNGTVYTHPVASTVENLYIISRKPFTEATATTQDLLNDLGIPRNYHTPLKWMLALELCNEFGKEPSQNVMIQAENGKTKILNLNMARNVHQVSLGLGSIGLPQRYGRGTILDS